MDRIVKPGFFLALLVFMGASPASHADGSGKIELLKNAVQSIRLAAEEVRLDTLQGQEQQAVQDFWDSLAYVERALNIPSGFKLSYHAYSSKKLDDITARDFDNALDYVKKVTNGTIRKKLSLERQDELLGPLDELLGEEIRGALSARLLNLQRLERKYGPSSAKLNLAEVFFNHFILRGVDAFGVDESGRPGPLEVILAYSTTYATYTSISSNNLGLDIASAVEVGIRYYVLEPGRIDSFFDFLVNPSYFSGGLLLVAQDPGVLRNPFSSVPAFGGFLTWGDVKFAVVDRGGPKLFVNKQFQLIPFVF